MTYSLLVIIRNGTFGINANWQDVALLLGTYVLWFFAYSWNPKTKKLFDKETTKPVETVSLQDNKEDGEVGESDTDDQCS